MLLVVKHNTFNGTKKLTGSLFFAAITKIWIAPWLYSVFLLGGDVELKAGPKQSSINAFST